MTIFKYFEEQVIALKICSETTAKGLHGSLAYSKSSQQRDSIKKKLAESWKRF